MVLQTSHHGTYHNDGLVVFKANKSVQEINDWLSEFQQLVDKASGKQKPLFTLEI